MVRRRESPFCDGIQMRAWEKPGVRSKPIWNVEFGQYKVEIDSDRGAGLWSIRRRPVGRSAEQNWEKRFRRRAPPSEPAGEISSRALFWGASRRGRGVRSGRYVALYAFPNSNLFVVGKEVLSREEARRKREGEKNKEQEKRSQPELRSKQAPAAITGITTTCTTYLSLIFTYLQRCTTLHVPTLQYCTYTLAGRSKIRRQQRPKAAALLPAGESSEALGGYLLPFQCSR